ncbi:MAG: CHASE2 domain-containing protein [Synechococcaceae bacterium WB8_1B_136]|nr:CHASE2 domain-containing protein [Synechococcaceae bacterium WB8_1B_136]
MAARIDLLIRQQATTPELLQVFVVAAGRQEAFVVPRPEDLERLQQVWRTRFLRHHDPAFAWPEGAAVVRSYSEQLLQGLQHWLQQPAWQPLQEILRELPAAPLTLRLDGVAEALKALPWEALALQRPIWRLDGEGALLHSAAVRARKPRILLLVGSETGLDLDGAIERLVQQQRSGRIRLTLLRGSGFTPAALRTALAETAGWDAVLYLGHSSSGPRGGLLHLGDGSQLDGQALEADWALAARQGLQLLLFNSCSGLQLAHHAARAGIDWAVCFLEPVPAAAAAVAFAQLLESLEAGSDLLAAIAHTRQQLAAREGFEGCSLLLAAVASPTASPLQLPLRRRRQLLLRLARSTRRQAIAAVAFTGLAFACELTPSNPVNTYLLNRRLELQRSWRELTRQPGPQPSAAHPPIPVLLLDPATTFPALGLAPQPDHTSRLALAAVLQRTPPGQVPVVGLDVLFDQDRPGTSELAAVLRAQPRRRVVGGELGPFTDPGQQKSSSDWLRQSPLAAAGLQVADLAVGTAAGNGLLKPVPLLTQYAITGANFAGALAASPVPMLPADRVIDWSINWADQIRLVEPVDLPTLQAPLLLVGTSGRLANGAADLFAAPATVQNALLQGDKPLWQGNAREMPGVLLQAVLIQSLNRSHWLTPLSLSLCTLAAAGLGVLLAAGLEQRQHRLIAVVLIAATICPLAFSLAVQQLWLLPLLLPQLALGATTFSRRD